MANVLIRDLDPTVHSVLASRAQARGQSLQQYLTNELTRLAARPTIEELFTEIDERPEVDDLPADAAAEAVRAGRADR